MGGALVATDAAAPMTSWPQLQARWPNGALCPPMLLTRWEGQLLLRVCPQPWLVRLSGFGTGLRTKGSVVEFLV